jgi:serine phosphatase RsbU (regulator of sigma subunit)
MDNVEYGFERLKKIILDSKDLTASEIITNIVYSIKTFSGTKLFRDDFTIIVLKRKMEQK